MTRSRPPLLLLLAITCLPASNVVAEDLSLSDLMDIQLRSGSFLELDLGRSPLSMTVIDRDRIDVSGARNLSELLEIYVPGFQYMTNKWNGIVWGMRGVANDRNTKFIVLIDGHKMNTEARDGFFQETSLGLFGEVERIEVLRGPVGLVYGSGAIAGVVNIVTREPTGNGSEVHARLGTWTGSSRKWGSLQGLAFGQIGRAGAFAATMGWQASSGSGDERLYGAGSWPLPAVAPASAPSGVPADGSSKEDPGSWKGTVNIRWDALRIEGRATHQVQEAGGMFPANPWPGNQGALDSTTPDAFLDGRRVAWNDPFWSNVGTGEQGRREYVADNIVLDASWDLPVGDDGSLKLRASLDANTDRILRRAASVCAEAQGCARIVLETFGERRYTAGATWLSKGLAPGLQLALGAEQRLDDIGGDLGGTNSQRGNASHPVVSDVLYSNTAVYAEGWYDLRPDLGVDFGLRWDGHTRTIERGGTVNGKLAGVWTPVWGHSVKLIFQSSSNNGSADNYEYNRNNFDDAGAPYAGPHFERPYERPDARTDVIYAVDADQLHQLRPERVYSLELTTIDDLGAGFSLSPSVSYNMVRDLFAWNQTLFRVVNVGRYDHIDLDLEAGWKGRRFDVGANHSIQLVVNTNVSDQSRTYVVAGVDKSAPGWYDSTLVDGSWYYRPVVNGSVTTTVNPVRDQITADGTNFLSLCTHVSKAWVTFRPVAGISLHTDVRIFWGLAGRDSTYRADEASGWRNLRAGRDPMVKWDAGIRLSLLGGWAVGLTAYDILGSSRGALAQHSLRWQEMATPDQRDLYAADLRSIALDVSLAF